LRFRRFSEKAYPSFCAGVNLISPSLEVCDGEAWAAFVELVHLTIFPFLPPPLSHLDDCTIPPGFGGTFFGRFLLFPPLLFAVQGRGCCLLLFLNLKLPPPYDNLYSRPVFLLNPFSLSRSVAPYLVLRDPPPPLGRRCATRGCPTPNRRWLCLPPPPFQWTGDACAPNSRFFSQGLLRHFSHRKPTPLFSPPWT